jgi:hypothetical protein
MKAKDIMEVFPGFTAGRSATLLPPSDFWGFVFLLFG